MNYEKMSNFKINQAVAREVFGCHDWSVNEEGTLYRCGADGDEIQIQKVPDYCNDPSKSWPIIAECKIDIQHRIGMPLPCAVHRGIMVANMNLLRAAMIVFLMMQENGK